MKSATGKNEKNWFTRNWKWAVPSGCLVVLVFKVIKQSDVYAEAVQIVAQHDACLEALGTPIKAGWFVSGSINASGPSGDADLAIPISGPYGEGTIFAVARKKVGRWDYEVLEVQVQGQENRIVIIESP